MIPQDDAMSPSDHAATIKMAVVVGSSSVLKFGQIDILRQQTCQKERTRGVCAAVMAPQPHSNDEEIGSFKRRAEEDTGEKEQRD